MLLKTNLYNRNYYPIKIFSINENVLASDKMTMSDELNINSITFNNDEGSLIKPFQNYELITSLSLNQNVNNFKGVIYLDSTIYTDSIDYGTFGVLSGLEANIKHHYVTLRTGSLFNNKKGGIVTKKDVDALTNESFINVKFSMKDIADLEQILDHVKSTGFSGYTIEDYDFFGEGINSLKVKNPVDDSCKSSFYRGNLINDLDTIIEFIEDVNNGKLKVYKENDNVYFDMELPGRTLSDLFSSINTSYKEMIKSEDYETSNDSSMDLPIVQLSMGMSVILQLKNNNNNTPYKINLKIVTPLIFFLEFPEQDITEDQKSDIKPLLNLIKNPDSIDRNTLLVIPSKTKLLTNPQSYYSSSIKVSPISLNNLSFETNINKDNFYTINNVTLKTVDYYTSNDLITFSSEPFPIKRIIPSETSQLINNTFDIFIDTTGILDTYTNTLVINYTYDSTVFEIESDIEIIPVLNENEPEIIPVADSIITEDSYKHKIVKRDLFTAKYIDTIYLSSLGEDNMNVQLKNIGEANAIIDKVEIENAFKYLDILEKNDNKSNEDLENITLLNECIEHHYFSGQYINSDLTLEEIKELNNSASIKKYINISLQKIDQSDYNAFGVSNFKIYFKLNKFKVDDNYLNGTPLIFKIFYRKKGSDIKKVKYLFNKYNFNLKFVLGKPELLYDTDITDIKYIRPSTRNTIFVDLFRNIKFSNEWSNMSKLLSTGIIIKDCKITSTDNNKILDTEYNIDKTQFPLSVSSLNSINVNNLTLDFNLQNERFYKLNLRIYTANENIPFIDIPLNIIATNVNVESIIKFDSSDFYVKNNKYFLSLVKLQTKNRMLSIVNTSNIEISILDIDVYTIADHFGEDNFDIKINNKFNLPFKITNKNSLKLDVDFIGKDFGHYNNFIILKTNLGDIYLSISSFVNTKYKDVYVLMENRKGTKFTSTLNGIDVDYIRLINFGEDKCFTEITKLGGYNLDNFKVAETAKLLPNTTNYIENVFTPTSTGKKISLANFKLNDMLETYKLLIDEETYIAKIQNSNIIAEMLGTALSENAVPVFDKNIIDFGYISINDKNRLTRVDNFTIKNYGITPFLITKISKVNKKSPFKLALSNQIFPIKVNSDISIPIYIDNTLLNRPDNIYYDIFKFEMQDLKSKNVFSSDIIVKLELTDESKKYVSLNSEVLEFGYCEINNFKSDTINIKNFSTDKLSLEVSYSGDIELQTLNNFNLNILPNQTFELPIYFYPHGIDNFEGQVKLTFDNDFEKNITLFGYGVDFKLPLIKIENETLKYIDKIKKYLS